MAGCIRFCIGTNYALKIYNMIKEQAGGIQGQEIEQGPLKDLVEQKRNALGISNPVRLVTLSRNNQVFIDGHRLSRFGNTIFPGSPGIAIPEGHNLNEREVEYLIVEQACRLKTNQTFLSQLAAMITGIATTVFLLPTFPIASFVLGALAGIATAFAISKFLEAKAMELVKKHATHVQIESGLLFYRRINQKIEDQVLRPMNRFPALFIADWLISNFVIAPNERLATTLEKAINRPA